MAGINIGNSPNFNQAGPTTAIRGGVNEAYVAPVISTCQTGEGNVSPTVGAAAGSVNAQCSYAPQTQHVNSTQGYYAPQTHTLWNEQHCFAPHLQAVGAVPQTPAALPPLPAAPPGYTIVRDANGLLRMLPLATGQGVPPQAPQPAGYPGAQQPAFGSGYPTWPQPAPFGGGMPPSWPAGVGPTQLPTQPQQAFHVPVPTAPGHDVAPQQATAGGGAPPQAAVQLCAGADAAQPLQAVQAEQQPPMPPPVQAMQPPASQPPAHVQQQAQQQTAPVCPAAVPQPSSQPQPAGLGGSAAAPTAGTATGGSSSVPVTEAPSAPPMPPDLLSVA